MSPRRVFSRPTEKKSVRIIQLTAGNNTGRFRWGISKGFIVRPSRVREQIERNKLINDHRHALCLFGLHPVRRVSIVRNQCSYTTKIHWVNGGAENGIFYFIKVKSKTLYFKRLEYHKYRVQYGVKIIEYVYIKTKNNVRPGRV